MPNFRGAELAEPLVGEVVAMRTFRVDCTGTLLPLYSHEAWYDGVNTATCQPPTGRGSQRPHVVPGDACECGFYAYGTVEAASRNRNMRYVQAVVSCWGGVVAGTQGVRAQHARIDAVWLSPQAPDWLRRRVSVRYPSAQVYADRAAMLAEHPLSQLPCYQPVGRQRLGRSALTVGGLAVAALGALPFGLLESRTWLWVAWLAALAVVATGAGWCAVRERGPGHLAALVLLLGVAAWLVSPALGLYGWFVRVPIAHMALVGVGGWLLTFRPWHFPVLDFEGSGRPT